MKGIQGNERPDPWKAPYWEVNGHKVNPPKGKHHRRGEVRHPYCAKSRGRCYLNTRAK